MKKIIPFFLLFLISLLIYSREISAISISEGSESTELKVTEFIKPTIKLDYSTGTLKKEELKLKLEEKQSQLTEKKQEMLTTTQELKSQWQEKKLEFLETLKLKREEAKESYQLKKQEFETKLQEIKDEKKKQIVKRINNRISVVNKNRSERMIQVLEKLSTIIDRLTEKVNTAKNYDLDTSASEIAIANAKTAVIAAQTAVTTQAGKSYVVEIQTEETLKAMVGSDVSQLESDLKIVHQAVVDAKQAVSKAGEEVAKLGSGQFQQKLTPSPVGKSNE
ncbi:hypothetical protein A3F03_03235 [Candidatus Roizmanbacteria bacterium RIFCSPHIGHO2_12_FULL_41_11]|uniref:Uncharacterized protein n=3 Tax=Candidatus Roizmaniibacteriota TaxID=1752723 RepID=A0A1F7JQD6_9BACT|nr:MAG: hypothetical protein A3F03_03235 [Candidatus Roizmanbacteria bacterium RIFCSPHIGHO2_12_FULL_41_11]OGK52697.1 MAG: hypothetical protein A2966_02560 [Candidatus Roizmanbacteria bacterium RIFCSPLOWO2_01_FULL_41_22]OGK57807.1 MAG: hypothetical protein A3H86_01735 [Candidatus Roizmanbacteria bacterium RIFCSPLOWO2_02_FULL_41_9]